MTCCCLKKKTMKMIMRGMWTQAQQPNPCLPRLLFHHGRWHNSPAHFLLYDSLSHLFLLSHRLRVVVSPVPAACPTWPLDTRLLTTLLVWLDWPTYKGWVSQPTKAAHCPPGLLPNWTVLDIRSTSLVAYYTLSCFSPKKKKGKKNGEPRDSPFMQSPLGGS